MRLPTSKEMRLPINKEMRLPTSKSGGHGIRPSLMVKWCTGEWYCDKNGCVCVGGTSGPYVHGAQISP
jgi:hypothetical protein